MRPATPLPWATNSRVAAMRDADLQGLVQVEHGEHQDAVLHRDQRHPGTDDVLHRRVGDHRQPRLHHCAQVAFGGRAGRRASGGCGRSMKASAAEERHQAAGECTAPAVDPRQVRQQRGGQRAAQRQPGRRMPMAKPNWVLANQRDTDLLPPAARRAVAPTTTRNSRMVRSVAHSEAQRPARRSACRGRPPAVRSSGRAARRPPAGRRSAPAAPPTPAGRSAATSCRSF